MIRRFFRRLRNAVKAPPYNPDADPIHIRMRTATDKARQQERAAREQLRVNRIESAYLRRRVDPRDGGHP